jgi:hypothetical protein
MPGIHAPQLVVFVWIEQAGTDVVRDAQRYAHACALHCTNLAWHQQQTCQGTPASHYCTVKQRELCICTGSKLLLVFESKAGLLAAGLLLGLSLVNHSSRLLLGLSLVWGCATLLRVDNTLMVV